MADNKPILISEREYEYLARIAEAIESTEMLLVERNDSAPDEAKEAMAHLASAFVSAWQSIISDAEDVAKEGAVDDQK